MSAKAYSTIWLALLAVPAFLWCLATLGPVRSTAFHLTASEPEYLANLREPEIACRTLRFRQPEAVVVGDSHSYAAWDFSELERRLGMRLGACALGGLYAESVPQLLQYVLRESQKTQLLILGLSPRMFWESPTKQEQIDFHEYLLRTMAPDASAFLRHAILRQPLPYESEARAVKRNRDRIEGLNEAEIETQIARSTKTVRSLRDWQERLERMRFASDTPKVTKKICDVVRSAGIRLWVLHIPESPYLEARYPQGVWRQYRGSIEQLAPCAAKIVSDGATAYGLGNRHYVNRALKEEYDYESWARPTPLTDDAAFDADHLNPVGAHKFTDKVLDRLGVAP